MRILSNTNIDFMKGRRFFVWVSVALLVTALAELFFLTGINLGIDFAGGTQMTVALRDDVPIEDLRQVLADAGIENSQIQRYGLEDSREVLIKAPVKEITAEGGETEASEEGSSQLIINALNQALNSGSSGFDLNQNGSAALADMLFEKDPDLLRAADDDTAALASYNEIAANVIALREPLFRSHDEINDIAGVSDEVISTIRDNTSVGAFIVRQNENVGPQIGSELRTKGFWAVVMSLIGMLCYIWYRFELRFGIGALVAVFHDFLITLGLYALFNFEFNLPTIAAFLTLVGYSVNDTVVIFDRVRENMRKHRRMALEKVMNLSINQTLSRTILTSGTTFMVVTSLFILGGEVIRGFAFVLMWGVVIGTYSSIFVASPFALLWEQYFGVQDNRKASTSEASS